MQCSTTFIASTEFFVPLIKFFSEIDRSHCVLHTLTVSLEKQLEKHAGIETRRHTLITDRSATLQSSRFLTSFRLVFLLPDTSVVDHFRTID